MSAPTAIDQQARHALLGMALVVNYYFSPVGLSGVMWQHMGFSHSSVDAKTYRT